MWRYSDFRVATQNACIYSCRRNTQGWMHLFTYQTLRWNAAGSCWLTRTFPITHNKRANGAERSICSLFCVCYISYEMSGIQGHRIQQSNCLATVLKMGKRRSSETPKVWDIVRISTAITAKVTNHILARFSSRLKQLTGVRGRDKSFPEKVSRQISNSQHDLFDSSPLAELGNKLSGEKTQGIDKIKSHHNSLGPSVLG